MKARSVSKAAQKTAMVRDVHAASLLGGASVLGVAVTSPLEVHEMILRGMPREALRSLTTHSRLLANRVTLAKAVGISVRTVHRHKNAPEKPLSQEQSERIWMYAEIFAQAIRVFGAEDAADAWLQTPAMGLNQRSPIDLMATAAGAGIVKTFLTRLEYGVYT